MLQKDRSPVLRIGQSAMVIYLRTMACAMSDDRHSFPFAVVVQLLQDAVELSAIRTSVARGLVPEWGINLHADEAGRDGLLHECECAVTERIECHEWMYPPNEVCLSDEVLHSANLLRHRSLRLLLHPVSDIHQQGNEQVDRRVRRDECACDVPMALRQEAGPSHEAEDQRRPLRYWQCLNTGY